MKTITEMLMVLYGLFRDFDLLVMMLCLSQKRGDEDVFAWLEIDLDFDFVVVVNISAGLLVFLVGVFMFCLFFVKRKG